MLSVCVCDCPVIQYLLSPSRFILPVQLEPVRQREHVCAMPVMRNREVNWGIAYVTHGGGF